MKKFILYPRFILSSYRLLGFISLILIISTSCKKEDDKDESIQLIPNAGMVQQVEINELVTLDATGSTGPAGFSYAWTYDGDVPENEINFQNKNTAKPSFIPPSGGVYTFTLTISYQGASASDETAVLAGGSIEIGGTLTEDLVLKNVQPNSSFPDYTVTSDLIIPEGKTLSIVEDEVIIAFNAGTGIHVQQFGTLTNVYDGQNYTFNSEFTGNEGWKGILIENGIINLEQTLIVNAGKSAFENQNEAAALTLAGAQTNLVSFSDNEFVNSHSYDILVTDKFPEVYRSVENNKLSYVIPIKAPITFMGFWFSENPNITPDIYNYIHLIPSGANTMDAIANVNGFSFYPQGTKFFIDGDFWAGSAIIVGGGSTIYMKENSSILADEVLLSFGTDIDPITFTGIDHKNWKGIVSRYSGSKSFRYTKILNAGHVIHEIGGFSS